MPTSNDEVDLQTIQSVNGKALCLKTESATDLVSRDVTNSDLTHMVKSESVSPDTSQPTSTPDHYTSIVLHGHLLKNSNYDSPQQVHYHPRKRKMSISPCSGENDEDNIDNLCTDSNNQRCPIPNNMSPRWTSNTSSARNFFNHDQQHNIVTQPKHVDQNIGSNSYSLPNVSNSSSKHTMAVTPKKARWKVGRGHCDTGASCEDDFSTASPSDFTGSSEKTGDRVSPNLTAGIEGSIGMLDAATSTVSVSNKDHCVVCSDIASGVHYGVAACEGCKGFFRRIVTSTTPLNNLQCNNGTDACSMTPSTRNTCQRCRLQKCFKVGMTRRLSKLGRRSKQAQLSIRIAPPRSTDPHLVYTDNELIALLSSESNNFASRNPVVAPVNNSDAPTSPVPSSCAPHTGSVTSLSSSYHAPQPRHHRHAPSTSHRSRTSSISTPTQASPQDSPSKYSSLNAMMTSVANGLMTSSSSPIDYTTSSPTASSVRDIMAGMLAGNGVGRGVATSLSNPNNFPSVNCHMEYPFSDLNPSADFGSSYDAPNPVKLLAQLRQHSNLAPCFPNLPPNHPLSNLILQHQAQLSSQASSDFNISPRDVPQYPLPMTRFKEESHNCSPKTPPSLSLGNFPLRVTQRTSNAYSSSFSPISGIPPPASPLAGSSMKTSSISPISNFLPRVPHRTHSLSGAPSLPTSHQNWSPRSVDPDARNTACASFSDLPATPNSCPTLPNSPCNPGSPMMLGLSGSSGTNRKIKSALQERYFKDVEGCTHEVQAGDGVGKEDTEEYRPPSQLPPLLQISEAKSSAFSQFNDIGPSHDASMDNQMPPLVHYVEDGGGPEAEASHYLTSLEIFLEKRGDCPIPGNSNMSSPAKMWAFWELIRAELPLIHIRSCAVALPRMEEFFRTRAYKVPYEHDTKTAWEIMIRNMVPVMQRVIAFCKLLPGLKDSLPVSDTVNLIKLGFFDIVSLRFLRLVNRTERIFYDPELERKMPEQTLYRIPQMGRLFERYMSLARQVEQDLGNQIDDEEMAYLSAYSVTLPGNDLNLLSKPDQIVMMRFFYAAALYDHLLVTKFKGDRHAARRRALHLFSLLRAIKGVTQTHAIILTFMSQESVGMKPLPLLLRQMIFDGLEPPHS